MTAMPGGGESVVQRCQTCLSAPDLLARNGGALLALSRKSPPRWTRLCLQDASEYFDNIRVGFPVHRASHELMALEVTECISSNNSQSSLLGKL